MTQTHSTPDPGDAEVIPFPTALPQPAEAEQVSGAVVAQSSRPPGPVEPVEVVDGEIVDEPSPAERVDTLDVLNDTGTWLDQRRAYMQAAPPVIPGYLRDRVEFTSAARFLASYYAHVAAWHATRSPLYALRLMGRGPRGAGRALTWWVRWVADTESAPLRHQAAASAGSTGEYMMLSREHSKRVKPRLVGSAIVGVPISVAVVVAVIALPTAAVVPLVAAFLAVCGLGGGRGDRPLIDRYVTTAAPTQRPLESSEIVNALEAIGIKGKPTFVNPIQTDGPGWRAELDLPPGYLAEKVLEERAKLAGAMRRPLTTVWPESDSESHPGRLVLWVAKQDPAKSKRRLWPLMRQGQTDLFTDIPFGFDPRGRVIPLNLMYTNLLMGGVPGSGKTSGVLVVALAGALDPTCEMWVYELKGSGDLDPVQPVCHRYVSGDDDDHCASALDALRKLEKELKRRKKIIADLPASEVPKGRKVYPHLARNKKLGLHPLLVIFDEAHTLFEHDEYGKEAADIAGRLIRKARAYGIILVITTQRPDAKSLPKVISDNVSTRFCLAVTGHIANDLVLGTSMYKNGVRATMFDPRKEAGTGWLAKSSHDTQIVRAAFIEQAEAIEVGKRAHALRVAAGALTGEAAGETITAEDTTTLLDHLAAVWPTGEDTMHSVRLVEALAAYRPDTYHPWIETDTPPEEMTANEKRAHETRIATTLSNALAPFGVATGQVTKRGDGGSRKGVKRADLTAALARSTNTDPND